jgi:hypothetical protein
MSSFFVPIARAVEIGEVTCFGAFCDNPANSATTLEKILTTVVSLLTVIAGLAFLIYFMLGALNWITAGGDKGKVDSAKSYMTNGVIGMIAVVSSYAVISIVGTVLGFNILNPAASLFNNTGTSSNPNGVESPGPGPRTVPNLNSN